MYYFHSYINFKNKYFDELKSLPAPLRETEIFGKIVSELPLEIRDDDLIPGRYGSTVRPGDPPYERPFEFKNAYTEDELKVRYALRDKFRIEARFDRGHFCLDYGYIIENGIKGYERKVCDELKKDGLSDGKRLMLRAMLKSVEYVKIYMGRFASLAKAKFDETGNEHFLLMHKAISRVPYEPAESFYEAVVSVWTMHSLCPLADASWASISLGRMDQYLCPLYKKDIENGISREVLSSYLEDLFKLLNLYGDGACALNIGGLDKDGNDMTNELSYLLADVEKQMCLASPIFALRVNPKTPDDIIDALIDKKLFTIGQPTFYGELPCRNAVIKRGVPESKAPDFIVNSCMGLYMCGEEIASMWGCIMNMHLPLELAVNGGRPIVHDMPFKLRTRPSDVTNLDELFAMYEKYLREICDITFGFNRKNAVNTAAERPNALLSMMTEGCIASGLDRAVGAKYNTETVEAMASANTANAICALDTLVFKEKKYTLRQYINAVQSDFEGHEDILTDIRKCEKYGTNSEYADGIMRRILHILSDICKEYSRDNVRFLPSLHTLDSNVDFGMKLYTTLDGRLKGQPVAKNAGCTNDVRSSDPTSLVVSAAAIDQSVLSGGQPIDLYFDKSLLETKEKRDNIKALVRTYFDLGGLQMQVNSIDIGLLERASRDPENHRHVVVRIGGYSRRFIELSKDAQREFIERFGIESAK